MQFECHTLNITHSSSPAFKLQVLLLKIDTYTNPSIPFPSVLQQHPLGESLSLSLF